MVINNFKGGCVKNTKETPLVSIIIPVYNGANYLKHAINSAIKQTYKNIEIIVINDGSDDNNETEKLAKSYGNKIRYYFKKNGGVASALNFGIKKMRGEYFSWLSHDDVYMKNKIKSQIHFINKEKLTNCIIYSDYSFMTANGRKFGRSVRIDSKEVGRNHNIALLKGYLNGITLLIPKEAFDKYGLFDEKLKCIQDYDKWFDFMKHYKFIHLSKVLVTTRLHDKQTTNTSPYVEKEGNNFWIKVIKSYSNVEKENIFGTVKNFYNQMAKCLDKTVYKKAYNYCLNEGKKYEG